jgi:acetylornithine deacetylase/succinyl-diaminopimelate desuccinylase-like protein
MGPSKENIAHTIDEYVSVDELFSAAQIYEWMMEADLCETNKVS